MAEGIRILTFGHQHGVPSSVDRVYDVRRVGDKDHDKEQEVADEIAEELKPGDCVGIGCEHGQYTSVGISRLVKKNLEDRGDDVTVTHRDLKREYNMSPLLKGNSKAVMNENMRTMMKSGHSEADATRMLAKKRKKNKKKSTLKQAGKE